MKKVEIHVTEKCLNNCVFCSVNKHYNPEPSLEEIYKNIERTKNKGFYRITITGGEPTLRKDIFKIISRANKYHKNILIETNGTNFTKEFVSKLIKSGVNEFKISFHSHNPAIFEKISNNKDNFYIAINALYVLKEFKNIKVGTNTVITKYNYQTIPETARWLNSTFPYLNLIRISYPRFYNYKKDYCKKEIVPLPKVRKYLNEIKEQKNKKVFLENVPLCICNYPHPEFFTWNLYLSQNGKIANRMEHRKYLKKCESCKLKKKCQGLHKYYNLYFPENFVTPYK